MSKLPEKIICKRTRDGEAIFNIPRTVTHHSPDGFEFGYGGSGPADLALQILQSYLEDTGYRGPKVAIFVGKVFKLAWQLHQPFKEQFIATMDRSGGTISRAEIQAWLTVNARQLAQQEDDNDQS